jgi:hypothetical protein
MSFWTDTRDALEGGAAIAGNYFLPGSGLVTSHLISDGAKQALGSQFGQLAMLGSGVAGGMAGNMSNYGGLSSMFGGTPEAAGMATTPSAMDADYQNGSDFGGAGSSPNSFGAMGEAAATTPAFMPSTLATGSNIPVDTTAGAFNPMGSANAGGGASLPDNIDAGGGYNPATNYNGPAGVVSGTSPGFLASMQAGNYGDALSAAGTKIMDNPIPSIYAAGSLYDMYAKQQMAKKQQDMYNQNRADIMGSYAPGSAEYNSLMNEMSRKDAAAGRNSQYGARAVDIAGRINTAKTQALSGMMTSQNALGNQATGNQYSMFNTPLTLAAMSATQKPRG